CAQIKRQLWHPSATFSLLHSGTSNAFMSGRRDQLTSFVKIPDMIHIGKTYPNLSPWVLDMTDRVMEQPPDTYDDPYLSWESHREIIKRLYVTEDRALPEVVEEMKRLHNFVATERMYKRRISRWNLDKNVKDEEMRAIIACEAMRSQQGKKSTFYVRGRLVAPKKIDRFAQRKRIDRTALDSVHGIELLDSVSVFRKGIKCITPPTDGPAVIDTVSDEPTYGRSKRRPTHSCTPKDEGSKRIRNLDNLVDQFAPSHPQDPIEQECADSILPQQFRKCRDILFRTHCQESEGATPSGQISPSNTNSPANGASTHRSLGQPEYTPLLSDTETSRTTQLGWSLEGRRISEYVRDPLRGNRILTELLVNGMRHSDIQHLSQVPLRAQSAQAFLKLALIALQPKVPTPRTFLKSTKLSGKRAIIERERGVRGNIQTSFYSQTQVTGLLIRP
ncbi:MAG: hypothetical protein Q9224_006201, partial [Gallowayella concinna]